MFLRKILNVLSGRLETPTESESTSSSRTNYRYLTSPDMLTRLRDMRDKNKHAQVRTMNAIMSAKSNTHACMHACTLKNVIVANKPAQRKDRADDQ